MSKTYENEVIKLNEKYFIMKKEFKCCKTKTNELFDKRNQLRDNLIETNEKYNYERDD